MGIQKYWVRKSKMMFVSVIPNLMVLTVLSTIGLSSDGRADDDDLQLTFFQAKREVIQILKRIELNFFSPQSPTNVNTEVAQVLEEKRSRLTTFIENAELIFTDERNRNRECAEIQNPEVREITISFPLCGNLSQNLAQRHLVREIFRKIANTSNETSRFASLALGDGWARNSRIIPPYRIVGNYRLNEYDLISGDDKNRAIELRIRATTSGYSINIDTLNNYNGERLQFSPLQQDGQDWTAEATNPSHLTEIYRSIHGPLYNRTVTGLGSEKGRLNFYNQNRISLNIAIVKEFRNLARFGAQIEVAQRDLLVFRGTKTE